MIRKAEPKRKAAAELTPAVAYIRMSSQEQEASPDQQREEAIKLAAAHGCRLVREYADEGISGDNPNRPGFQALIRDAVEQRDFAAIICWDQDRFARFDMIKAGRYIDPLREAGVWLITKAQGVVDWNTFTGRMMYSIVQEGKHQYLIDLSRNVLRGKVSSAKKGTSGSNPPWGMDRELYDEKGELSRRVRFGDKFRRPKGWTVRFVVSQDSDAVGTVRWMFNEYAHTDAGLTTIAGNLNRRGIKSPCGKSWSTQTVENILTNETYLGSNVFGRRRCGKYHHLGTNGETVRGDGREKPGEPIVTSGIHEALIEEKTFSAVQLKLTGRRQTQSRDRQSSYLLSGVLRCGHCGGTMAGRGYTDRLAHPCRYYTCVTASTRPGACARYQIPQEPMDRFILGVLEKQLCQDGVVKRIKDAIHRQAASRPAIKRTTKALQARLTTLDKKIAKGRENLLLAKPEDMDDLSSLLAEWRKERADLEVKLESAVTTPGGMTSGERAEKAIAELKALREHLESGEPARVRHVVKGLIKDIQLWFAPYGKQKRLTRGLIHFRNELQLAPMASRVR